LCHFNKSVFEIVCLCFIISKKTLECASASLTSLNGLFVIIVVSFITSVLGIWKVIPGEMVVNLYQTFALLCFASLHSDILSKALHKETYLNMLVYFNYVLIAIVVLMLLPIIYISNSFSVLGEVYFRLLGAAGIIDGTLSILAIIFYKLYMNKHPKEQNSLAGGTPVGKVQKKGLSIWVWILIVYLLLQVILPLIFLGGFWAMSV